MTAVNEQKIFKRTKVHTIYKTAAGKTVPGVTTVLGELAKPALIPWAWKCGRDGIELKDYVDTLAGIGQLAHAMILAHLRNEKPDFSEYSPKQVDLAENCLISYFEWERQHTIEPIQLETPMVDECLEFGGTPDFYGKVDGIYELIDFKTGKGIYQDFWYQIAAYQHLIMDQVGSVGRCRILNIGRSEDEAFKEEQRMDLIDEWKIFTHALLIYKIKKRMRGKA